MHLDKETQEVANVGNISIQSQQVEVMRGTTAYVANCFIEEIHQTRHEAEDETSKKVENTICLHNHTCSDRRFHMEEIADIVSSILQVEKNLPVTEIDDQTQKVGIVETLDVVPPKIPLFTPLEVLSSPCALGHAIVGMLAENNIHTIQDVANCTKQDLFQCFESGDYYRYPKEKNNTLHKVLTQYLGMPPRLYQGKNTQTPKNKGNNGACPYPNNLYQEVLATVLGKNDYGKVSYEGPQDMVATMKYAISTLHPNEKQLIKVIYEDGSAKDVIKAQIDTSLKTVGQQQKELLKKLSKSPYLELMWLGKAVLEQGDGDFMKDVAKRIVQETAIWQEYPLNVIIEISGQFPVRADYAEGFEKVLSDESFTEREALCIHLRYRDKKTYKEIGEELGVQGSRAQQIIAKTLRKLRHPRRTRQYKYDYLREMDNKRRQQKFNELHMRCCNCKFSHGVRMEHRIICTHQITCLDTTPNRTVEEKFSSMGAPVWCPRRYQDGVKVSVYKFLSSRESAFFHIQRKAGLAPQWPERKYCKLSHEATVNIQMEDVFVNQEDIPGVEFSNWDVVEMDDGVDKLCFTKTEEGYQYVDNF